MASGPTPCEPVTIPRSVGTTGGLAASAETGISTHAPQFPLRGSWLTSLDRGTGAWLGSFEAPQQGASRSSTSMWPLGDKHTTTAAANTAGTTSPAASSTHRTRRAMETVRMGLAQLNFLYVTTQRAVAGARGVLLGSSKLRRGACETCRARSEWASRATVAVIGMGQTCVARQQQTGQSASAAREHSIPHSAGRHIPGSRRVEARWRVRGRRIGRSPHLAPARCSHALAPKCAFVKGSAHSCSLRARCTANGWLSGLREMWFARPC